MTTITTKLIKDGNSVAVRLPKHALILSGLHGTVQMEVREGQVTLRATTTPRDGWKKQIARVVANSPNALLPDAELTAWDTTIADGLDDETR